MNAIDTPAITEKLWHSMLADFGEFVPGAASQGLLMCCCCGRYLPFSAFSLEHLIPQQAVKNDPIEVRSDKQTPTNVRSGNLLLCKTPVSDAKGRLLSANGCNGYKGRHYDNAIRELIAGPAWGPNKATQVHITAALSLSYLAMVKKFGFRIALMPSGRLMQRQFFNPLNFQKELPFTSTMLAGGDASGARLDAPMWRNPFSITVNQNTCYVATRNFAIAVPVSQNPEMLIPRHLPYVPSKFKFRVDWRAVL